MHEKFITYLKHAVKQNARFYLHKDVENKLVRIKTTHEVYLQKLTEHLFNTQNKNDKLFVKYPHKKLLRVICNDD